MAAIAYGGGGGAGADPRARLGRRGRQGRAATSRPHRRPDYSSFSRPPPYSIALARSPPAAANETVSGAVAPGARTTSRPTAAPRPRPPRTRAVAAQGHAGHEAVGERGARAQGVAVGVEHADVARAQPRRAVGAVDDGAEQQPVAHRHEANARATPTAAPRPRARRAPA